MINYSKTLIIAGLLIIIIGSLFYIYYNAQKNDDPVTVKTYTAADCPELAANIQVEIQNANYCGKHTDCAEIDFSCVQYINREQESRLKYLLNSLNIWCRGLGAKIMAETDCVSSKPGQYIMCQANRCQLAFNADNRISLATDKSSYLMGDMVKLIVKNESTITITIPEIKEISPTIGRLYKKLADAWQIQNTYVPIDARHTGSWSSLKPREIYEYGWKQDAFWENAKAIGPVAPGTYRLELILSHEKELVLSSNEFELKREPGDMADPELSLVTDKNVYASGQPVNLSLINNSAVPADVWNSKYISERIADLEQKSDAEWKKVNLIPLSDEPALVELAPNARRQYIWNQKIYKINEPGYPAAATGTYRFKFLTAYSNEFTIN